MPAAMIGRAQIVIAGSRFTSTGMGVDYEGTVELHLAKKDVKGFDLLFTAGPPKGTRNRGIYRLSGDKWTICLSTDGGKRPTAFATTPGSGLALETLERKSATGKSASRRTVAKQSPVAVPAVTAEEQAASGEPTELEGEWAMVSAVFGGAAMDENMVQWCGRITRGNVTTVVAGPQTMLKARFTLNATSHPRSIDYVNLHGSAKGKSQAGIYELSGNTLRICMSAPGKPRPGGFESKAGDGRSFTTWKRRQPGITGQDQHGDTKTRSRD
jgi:uncharacterized protein (TIGR03067 family)